MTTDTDDVIPQRVGRFELTGELGGGAMSVVYKAYDPEINRVLAIKLLRGECATDAEYRFRFLQEARAAGKLTHSNIVTIFDVGEAPQGPYIAMEYLPGVTLAEAMSEGHSISLRMKLVYAVQLADALAYSHGQNVVHRDVKPGNVMLSEDRQIARLTDFGVARIETPGRVRRTLTGSLLGTPQYMSPEQVEGKAVDGRSDLFSLGVILYELITGEQPFRADSLSKLLLQITREEAPAIGNSAPSTPESLQRIVEKLLRKQPGQRYQSGKEVADALRSLLLELDEQELRKRETKILPLRIKWTAVMSVVVGAAMLLGSYLVYHRQVDAMTGLALDSGSSLAEFIAIESAESLLIQDWIAIEVFVNEVSARQRISYLEVIDHKGILRGSTDAGEVGSSAPDNRGARKIKQVGNTEIYERRWHGEEVFDFHIPVRFQEKTIGNIRLGLARAPVTAAAQLTLYTLLALFAAVVVTVAVVAYLLPAGITLATKSLSSALRHVANGNYNHRIEERRNDELGELFENYNAMAQALQERSEAGAVEAAMRSGDVDDAASDVTSEVTPARQAEWLAAEEEMEAELLADAPTMIILPERKT
ncbi:MAG: protein kinase [Gammaproteobacteria bacterium]|nr:protein kinase [Gammaproteobacteria bacterium]